MLEHVAWPYLQSHFRYAAVNGRLVGDFTNEHSLLWSGPRVVNAGDMEDSQTHTSSFWFHALRVMAGLMVIVAGLAITYSCVSALMGDTTMLVDFIDEDKAALSMTGAAIIAVAVTNFLALTSLGLLLVSLNRFLSLAGRGTLLIGSARNALKRMGIAMFLLYVTSRFLAVGIPLAGIEGFWEENAMSLPFLLLDLDFLYLLVGVVLLALRQALHEGQTAKEEVRQYV